MKKKSIFILATLLVTTFANAQITLEHTFDGWFTISADMYGDLYNYVQSPYYYNVLVNTKSNNEPQPASPERVKNSKNESGVAVELYDVDDYSLYKSIKINPETYVRVLSLVSRNILSTDNKVCFCLFDEGDGEESYIYNEDGELLATIKGTSPAILKVNDKYILISRYSKNDKQFTYIYSLPGNGDADTDLESPEAPRKASARKVARDGQVYIQSNAGTYTIQGREVK